MSKDLDGKVAVITGGANGIGKATVETFVEQGARVVIADVQAQEGRELAQRLGAAALFVETDVTGEASWEALIAATEAHFGPIDILFNNAGGGGGIVPVSFVDRDFSQFTPVINLNLYAPLLGMKLVGRRMIDRGTGVIINCCSTGAFYPGIGIPFYRAAKAGLLQVSQSVALEFAPLGVRVNCVSPGPVAIEDFGKKLGLEAEAAIRIQDKITAGMLQMQALKQPIRAGDIADAVAFLASDRARSITGHNLVVAAGNSLGDMIDRAQEMKDVLAS